MPIVTIEESAGRTDHERRAVAKGITEAFANAYGSAPESVTIIFHALAPNDLAKAGRLSGETPTEVGSGIDVKES